MAAWCLSLCVCARVCVGRQGFYLSATSGFSWTSLSCRAIPARKESQRVSSGLTVTSVFTVLRNIFVLTCIIIACSLLFPVLWHLWIYAGSANSNFFYAITLTFNVGQVRVKGTTGTKIYFVASDVQPGSWVLPKQGVRLVMNEGQFLPSSSSRTHRKGREVRAAGKTEFG